MRLYTVSFFGQDKIEDYYMLKGTLYTTIRDIIDRYDFVEFILNYETDFDGLAADIIRDVRKVAGRDNSAMILFIPGETKVITQNRAYFERVYDEIEVCEQSLKVGKMKAVTVRNRTAIDRSDLCIFYAKEAHRNAGPFSMAMKYAKKSDCIIMDLYEEYDNSTYARLFNEQTKQ